MLSFAADENFNGAIVRGLLLRLPSINIVRVQDAGLTGISDSALLEWAAVQKRIIVTHDVQTLPRDAYARVRANLAMPGVIAVSVDLPVGPVIAELLLVAQCGLAEDFEGQVQYLRIGLPS